jgi:hypothetical protein
MRRMRKAIGMERERGGMNRVRRRGDPNRRGVQDSADFLMGPPVF